MNKNNLSIFPLVSLDAKSVDVNLLIDFCSKVSLMALRAINSVKLPVHSRPTFVLEGLNVFHTNPLNKEFKPTIEHESRQVKVAFL